MLTLRNLVVHRGGKPVLHGFDMDVAPGQVTALVGANGAGKSSTVMAIAGAIAVKAGSITAGTTPLHNQRPEFVRAAGVAVVPEGHRVLGDLSVHDNLRVAGTALHAAELQAAIERALDIFPELRPKLDTLGRALSGGQKQMVCIAQALIAQPAYMVIDELSLGLAPMVVRRLADVVQQVAARGVGVLLIEQFTTLALAISTQAYVMERGRLAFSGSSQALRDQPEILHSSYLAAKA
ncbi:MAG: ATP-binding cassette domain-containing protein [Burkholderiaceae bacterium]